MTTPTRPPSRSAEDRLRDAMHAYTAPIEPDPYAWTRIRGRIEEPSPKRSRTWTFATLSMAVAAALLVALLLPSGESRTQPPPIGGGDPAGVVVVDDRGRLVVAARGGEPSTLARIGRAPAALGTQLAVTPDARFVFVARRPRGSTRCESELVRVRLRDGRTRVVAENAVSPAISADGSRLAYVEIASPAEGHIQCRATLVVRDLATGTERRWVDPVTVDVDPASGIGDSRFPNTLVWAPDGRYLAFVESYEADNDVSVLDTTSPPGVLAATGLRPTTDPGPNRSWGLVGYLIDGSPLLRTYCYGTVEDCPGRTVLGVLDTEGVLHETITIPRDAEGVTLDAGGSWVLYVRFQNAESGSLEQLALAEGARAEDLGEGVRFAAFLPSTARDHTQRSQTGG